ncbi:MAG: type II secretion system F family protein [Desulfobulbaceae bacterium]|nr:type II secretion system F family protein [Desulfobulbaceae bacterium]HIJ78340.1 type II secretion system F family protein [Deltaproteobacteria bacterium]
MASFKYSALDHDNVLRNGILEAIDRDSAAKTLVRQGLRPVDIRRQPQTAAGGLGLKFRFGRQKLKRNDIDFFTNQIGLLLKSGLSLDAALRVMKNHSAKPEFQEFVAELGQKIKEGKSFSQALSEYPYFSPMYINIVRAGEEGGILPAMLSRIAGYQATFQELSQYIISASIYPLFLLAVGLVAIVILLTTILPRFEILFAGMGQQLPGHVAMLMATAKTIGAHPLLALLLLTGPPAALICYFKTPEGRERFDYLSLKIPVIAGFVRSLETTRIFRTIEVLVNNGVHLAMALKISSGVAGNIEYRRLLNQATQALKEGKRIGGKLGEARLFPELATELLAIGEESGRVGEMCGQIADHFEGELKLKIKRLTALVEPIFILLIALVAGYVVISMLSVILSINDIAG